MVVILLAGAALPGTAQLLPAGMDEPAPDERSSGDTPRGWLGIVMGDHGHGGVIVRGLFPGTTAAEVLHLGDRIVALDGVAIENRSRLVDLLASRSSGSTVHLAVERSDGTTGVSVQLSPAPADITQAVRGHVGELLPSVRVLYADDAGRPWRREDHERPALLAWWAIWCGACREVEPDLHQVAAACSGELDVLYVAPHPGDEIVRARAGRQSPGVLLADGDGRLMDALGLVVLPTWMIVDAEGSIRALAIGRGEIRAWLSEPDAGCPLSRHLAGARPMRAVPGR